MRGHSDVSYTLPGGFHSHGVAHRPLQTIGFIFIQQQNHPPAYPHKIEMASMAYTNAPSAELPTAGQAAIRGINDAGLGEIIHLPGSDVYEVRIKSYYSLTPQLRPWAIVQPRSTEEVSIAIKVLTGVPECKFAIRRYVDDAKSDDLTHDGRS